MKLIVPIFFLFIHFFSLSQSKGFFGRRNIIEISTTVQSPLLYNYYSAKNTTAYLAKNGALENKMPLLNYGFRLNIGRMTERDRGIYLESGLNYFSVAPNTTIYSNAGIYHHLKAEMLDVRTFSVMPKIEFASADGLLPVGISNQFGIGINYYQTQEKNYLGTVDSLEVSNGMTTPVNITTSNYYDFHTKAIKGYTFLYKLSMRIPITERILFHFGFRYTYNYIPSLSGATGFSHTTAVSKTDMWELIRHKETRSLITFETGLSFCF